ncbi:MAG TPA: hypothetical protein VF062_00780 [Candidatus Limnocylindrales bacterium]
MFRRKGAPAEDRDPRQPGRLRRAGQWYMASTGTLVASATLLCIILAGGIYLVLVPAPTVSDQPSRSAARPAVTVASGAPEQVAPALPAADPAASLCPKQRRVDMSPETVVLAMYDTQWEQSGGALVPRSDGGGPATTTAPRSCFTRTPEGALYSLATFFTQSTMATDAAARITLTQARASRTGAYQQLMDALQVDPNIAANVGAQPELRITGYRWIGYTPDTAHLELRYQAMTGAQAGVPIAMILEATWESNDWLIVVPSPNAVLHQPGSAQTTFTPWGPPA